MSVERYIAAAIPEPYVVLGVPLKPFCLGHYFLMKRFDCAYASEDQDVMASVDDLLLAISICSRSYHEYLDFIYEGAEFERWHSEWGNIVKQMQETDPTFNMFEKFDLFNKYRRDGMKVPEVWNTKGETVDPSGVHWSQAVLQVLMADLGYTEEQAMNMPLAKAFYEFYSALARSGAVAYPTEDEEPQIEEQLANARSKV